MTKGNRDSPFYKIPIMHNDWLEQLLNAFIFIAIIQY